MNLAIKWPNPEKWGGLNGSMQHLLDGSLKEPGKLISCVGINPNKSKALFRFLLSPIVRTDSRLEGLSDRCVPGCCIDRLNRQGFSESGFSGASPLQDTNLIVSSRGSANLLRIISWTRQLRSPPR